MSLDFDFISFGHGYLTYHQGEEERGRGGRDRSKKMKESLRGIERDRYRQTDKQDGDGWT